MKPLAAALGFVLQLGPLEGGGKAGRRRTSPLHEGKGCREVRVRAVGLGGCTVPPSPLSGVSLCSLPSVSVALWVSRTRFPPGASIA